ncbi:glycoside hydrolase family 17 protein [Sphaerobolus stellatus SS14]|uniref:Glycoside hydrolase family 17 protein n=1 Tax=Sphaerobolus stellatus (strain SS14) TaxID=990650 RepID=A0A0C9VFR4_SPHS4|nr:glycoside hydrolase family 17 protein [Sphaerobolus stellatus SS14]
MQRRTRAGSPCVCAVDLPDATDSLKTSEEKVVQGLNTLCSESDQPFNPPLAVHTAIIPPNTLQARDSNCFPFGATISGGEPPSVSRDEWWCVSSQQYGFLGFSYPLEDADCNAYSNQLAKISQHFQRMESDFGATMVRVYAPECREESVWKNLLQAENDNNIAAIPQVWWGFGDQNLWRHTAASVSSVLSENPLAPFDFHSIAFNSEPIGDSADGDPSNFAVDLKQFKTAFYNLEFQFLYRKIGTDPA